MRAVAALILLALAAVLIARAPGSHAQTGGGGSASAVAQVLTGSASGPVARGSGTSDRNAGGAVNAPGIRIDNSEATVKTRARAGTASATAVARSVTLLDGRVTAYGVRREVQASDGGRSVSGSVDGLRIDGRRYDALSDPRAFTVSGVGRVTVNTGGTGLRLQLTAAAGGLAAGTDLRIASVSATARAAAPAPSPTATATATSSPKPKATRAPRDRDSDPDPDPSPAATKPKPKHTPAPKRRKAPDVNARLTRSGFAFPIYPPDKARVADSYGGPRPAPIVSHEGVDIFAPFGSPVVAVADGKLSKVGTLPISGNRLWLTTPGGDAFFYAHLSSFAPAAISGREVKAGTVLGFTGNTGDAEPTPPHVHLEVHPGGEEAPSVNPYPIVTAWQGRDDVAAGAFLRREGADTATRPGALTLVRDPIAQ